MDDLIKAQSELTAELKLLAEALKKYNEALNTIVGLGKETVELLEAHTKYLNGDEN